MRLINVELSSTRRPRSGRARFARASRLPRDIGARDGDLTLERADADVGVGDVAEQRDEHVVIGGDRGEIGGVGRFDSAPEFAPEIEFPGRLNKPAIGPEIAERRRIAALRSGRRIARAIDN